MLFRSADLVYPKNIGKVRLRSNDSGKFESRASRLLAVPNNPSVFAEGMDGSELYAPTDHGEGKFSFSPKLLNYVLENNLIVFKYIDPKDGYPTMSYPSNPNGSPWGIAGITSKDGRVLIMMPHPERAWLIETDPWKEGYIESLPKMGPYFKLAQNAYDWCTR